MVLLLLFFHTFSKSVPTAAFAGKSRALRVVVIDAGHGGDEPGKIGISGSRESEINLQIARYTAAYLEALDVSVILTRQKEEGLYEENTKGKKIQDLKKRVAIMNEAGADVVVSIHQNAYPEEYVKGAQVFYYKDSKESMALAKKIQKRFVTGLDPENKRQVKADGSYYLLKKTSVPIVIAECGFLSNREEEAKLTKEDYQRKVAWEIALGVLQYLNEE